MKGSIEKGTDKGFKGMWNNSQGKGYGYQGVCWNCGKVGHKSNECGGINEVEGEDVQKDEMSVELGRIWNICKVDVDPRVAGKSYFVVLDEDAERGSEDEDVQTSACIGRWSQDGPSRGDDIIINPDNSLDQNVSQK